MSLCKVSRLFLQGFTDKIRPQLKTECGDFGCEERADGAKAKCVVYLEDENGRQRHVEVEDEWLTANGIEEYRRLCGLTQAELAEKIDISTKQISRLELGDFYPSLNTFFKIVETLNMDLNDFMLKAPNDDNKIRIKLVNAIYNASEEELSFYDRLLTFANDEVAELKKNLLIKTFR